MIHTRENIKDDMWQQVWVFGIPRDVVIKWTLLSLAYKLLASYRCYVSQWLLLFPLACVVLSAEVQFTASKEEKIHTFIIFVGVSKTCHGCLLVIGAYVLRKIRIVARWLAEPLGLIRSINAKVGEKRGLGIWHFAFDGWSWLMNNNEVVLLK